MDAIELTILMPCLNEARTLATCINKAKKFLQQENIRGEILIADNGSQDGSQAIAKAHGARVIPVTKKGYGAALKGGIAEAKGQFIIMGDADDSYDFTNLHAFINKLRQGYDLVMGNRFQGGIVKGAMPMLNRYLGNPVLSWIGRIFFRSPLGDFHCGLRGFKRDAFLRLALQGDGMEFASEMIIKATLAKLTITEVPTKLYPDGRDRRPHLRPWRDGWRHLRLLLLWSPNWLFLYPGLFLMLTGFILMLLLLRGPVEFGHINLDIHTLLFSGLFIIIGMQAVCFAIYANLVSHVQLPIFKKIYQALTLERGLLAGIFLLLIGISGACYSLYIWFAHSFGPLVPSEMMRILIPASTCMILGSQFILTSFFFSLLRLHYDANTLT